MNTVLTNLTAKLPEFSGGIFAVSYFGNTVGDYVEAGIILLVSLAVFGLLHFLLLHRLAGLAEKTKTDIDDVLVRIVRNLRPPFYVFVAFYVAMQSLIVHGVVEKIVEVILVVWVVYQIIRSLEILVEFVVTKKFDKDGDGEADGAVALLARLVRGVLWALGGLFILQNVGVDVTALIAGIGVGGIAIAFALQNVLEDLFSSFSIHFDKPFVVGDFIVIGEKKGTVERIGVKTTRLRALQGEELVVSNRELTSVAIQNYGAMEERRIEFEFGVTYETAPGMLRKIPVMVEQLVEQMEKTRFDRCFFKTFGDSALVFNSVYFVDSGEYAEYARANQELFIKIMESFSEAGIEMAFPTRTVHVVNSSEGVRST